MQMQVGDKVKIINYGMPDDEELIEWASEQPEDKFSIIDIDLESQMFYIKGCMYGIPINSIDYKLIKE